MADLIPVLVPLVNPNESESVIARLAVKEGQQVKQGALLAVFETTKATFELCAEQEGFVLGLTAREGDQVKTGERLCYLAQSRNATLPEESEQAGAKKLEEPASDYLITRPALALAREHDVNLKQFTQGTLITEKMVQEVLLGELPEAEADVLIIYGGGGHAKSLIDLIRAQGKYRIHGVLDDGIPAGSLVLDVPVLGDGSMLKDLRRKGIGLAVNAVGGIGSIRPRLAVFESLRQAGFAFPTVVHPRAVVESTALVAEGCQIFCHAYIGSAARVGFGCIVNTGAVVSHDCVLADYVNISPGAILAGAVTVKEKSLVGMGVTVNLNVSVGPAARVGNSAVVKGDVPENGIVRAGAVWPEA